MSRLSFALIIVLLGLFPAMKAGDPIIGPTVLDCLKDGFDAVFKYESYSGISFFSHLYQKTEKSDVLLRKSTKVFDVPKLVMHIENPLIETSYEESLKPTDLTALAHPIVVPIADADCLIDEFIATERDTQRSLIWKHSVLKLLERNFTDTIVTMGDRLRFEKEVVIEAMPFGICHANFTYSTEDKRFMLEFHGKREACDGNYSAQFLNYLKGYEDNKITGVTNETVFTYTLYFDKATHQFVKDVFKVQGKFIGEEILFYGPDAVPQKREIPFEVQDRIEFQQYRPILEEFDETTITQLYNGTNF